MRKYSVFGIRSSVFALLITGYWILNTLTLPSPSLAACTGVDDTCPEPGTQSTCCADSTCIATGTQNIPGICKSTINCGGQGQICCSPNNTCQGTLECNLLGICAEAGTPPPQAGGDASPFCDKDVNKGVSTAIGCLMAQDPKQFISQLLGWGVGIGGGIAFLMIVLAGFQMATASGDPKKVQAARELLMSALAGLIIIALSLVLLNFIGVKILNLPGFVGNPNLNL